MRGLKFEGGYHTFTPTHLDVYARYCELKMLVYIFHHLPFFKIYDQETDKLM